MRFRCATLVVLSVAVATLGMQNIGSAESTCNPPQNSLRVVVETLPGTLPPAVANSFGDMLRRMLREAQIESETEVAQNGSSQGATGLSSLGELRLELGGEALSGTYHSRNSQDNANAAVPAEVAASLPADLPLPSVHPEVEPTEPADSGVRYSGASVKGRLVWSSGGREVHRDFEGRRVPPGVIGGGYRSAEDAPFKDALLESREFIVGWHAVLTQMVGTERAGASLMPLYRELAPGNQYDHLQVMEFLNIVRNIDGGWRTRPVEALKSSNPHCWVNAAAMLRTMEFQELAGWSPSRTEDIILLCVEGRVLYCAKLKDDAVPILEKVLTADGELGFRGQTMGSGRGYWQSQAAQALGDIGTPLASEALQRCRSCSPEVEVQLRRLQPPFFMRVWFWVAAIVVLVAVVVFCQAKGWLPSQ